MELWNVDNGDTQLSSKIINGKTEYERITNRDRVISFQYTFMFLIEELVNPMRSLSQARV
jgi:hypothetical protein